MARPTPAGVSLGLAAVLTAITGFASGIRELMLLGTIALFAIVWDGIWLLLHARPKRAQLQFPGAPPSSGYPINVDLTVINDSVRSTLPTVLTVAAGPGTVLEVPLVSVARRAQQSLRILLPPQARGWLDILPVRTHTVGPLGLTQRRSTITKRSRVLVRPAAEIIPSVVGLDGDIDDSESDSPLTFAQLEDEFAEVREFLPGDEVRRVHWPTTARIGSPAVREYEKVGGGRVCIYCDPGTESTDVGDRERAIHAAASLAVSCLLIGSTVELTIGDLDQATLPSNSGPDDALDLLALAEPRTSQDDSAAHLGLAGLFRVESTAVFICTPSASLAKFGVESAHDRSPTIICTDSGSRYLSTDWISFTSPEPFSSQLSSELLIGGTRERSTRA